MTDKLCKKCGHRKPLEEFNKSSSNPDGKQYWCKPCMHVSSLESAKTTNDATREAATLHRELWTMEDEQALMEMYAEGHSDRVIAYTLGRTLKAVHAKKCLIKSLGLSYLTPVPRTSRVVYSDVAVAERVQSCPSCFMVHAPAQEGCE